VFRLHDQFGRSVTPGQFHGRPIVITFMEAHCQELCPIVAEKLRRTISALGPAGRRIVLLAISTAPESDTVSAVRRFSQAHGMFHRWHYLTGSRQRLQPVWRAYAVYAGPANAPPAIRDMHTSVTYLIDTSGREQVLFASSLDTPSLDHDLRILSGLPVGSIGREDTVAPGEGHAAPDFVLRSVAGPSVALSSFFGKVVLVNFWATWCIPCRTEMPEIAGWYRRLRGRGLVVLGVDKQEPRGDVVPFLHSVHASYPVVLDSDGSVSALYNIIGLPTSVVVDRQGVIRTVHIGIIDHAFLKGQLEPLLGAQVQK